MRRRFWRKPPVAEEAPIHFAVLGAGAWGTAVAIVLAQKSNHRVSLWSARAENARELHQHRQNVRLLPGVPIPDTVHLTTDIAQAVHQAELLAVAVPTVHLRGTLERIAWAVPPGCPALSLTKGLEISTFLRPTEIIRQARGERPLAVLSGPSHAEEVARFLPATLVAASADRQLALWVQQQFTTQRFRVYTND